MERMSTLTQPPQVLPLRLGMGAICAAVILASYPVAFIDHDIIVAGATVPAACLRASLLTLLNVAGLISAILVIRWCEVELVRRARRALNGRCSGVPARGD